MFLYNSNECLIRLPPVADLSSQTAWMVEQVAQAAAA